MSIFPPISALRALEAVVRHGSVTRAAEELGRTHGAVSKHLKTLHEQTGLTLFTRQGVTLAPTFVARELAQATRRSLDDLTVAYERILDDARGPSLRIACGGSLATRWLTPRLTSFAALRPDIRLSLAMATDGPYEAQRDADITLLYHLPGASTKGTHAVPVGDVEVVIAATAKYMAAMGAGANPRPVRRLSDNLTDGFWAAADFRGQTPPASDADLRFAHIATALEACLSGHGAMAVDRRMIESELLDGRLTVVGPRFTFKESVVAACKASGTGDVERQEFLKWLRLALAAPHDPPTAATPPPKTETMRSAPLFKTTNYIGNRK